jgi:UDP-N-acetylmuramate: L-alanyl-gamma-D-glutamyl-meso-diaminopimelate ligase
MESLRVAFRRLLSLVPRSGRTLIGADSPEAARLAGHARGTVETFGIDAPEADWRASAIRAVGGRITFDVSYRRDPFGQFVMPLHGAHNVRNALAAIAVGHAVGASAAELERGLAAFQGVRRRLELRGMARGVSVYDDFAHHPTAILETLRAVRWSNPDHRIWAIFEPRSATSCRRVFQQDFARAFSESGADEVVLAAVFRSSLPADERLDVEQLVDDLKRSGHHARLIPKVEDIVRTIAAEARDGDLVVVMSNGGFDGIHDRLLQALRG